MKINHNISALNAYRNLAVNNSNTAKNLEKLSSGLRINRASDDAAGLAISEKMRSQIRGLEMAERNALDAVSFVQTAEGALSSTHSILQRMRELAVQAANDSNTEVDRAAIQQEIDQLTNEVNRIANTTEFNTKKLLNGDLEIFGKGRRIKEDSVSGDLTVTDIAIDNTNLKANNLKAGNYQVTFVTTDLTQSTISDTKATINSSGTIGLSGGAYLAVVSTEAVLGGVVAGTSATSGKDVFNTTTPIVVATNSTLDGNDYQVQVAKDASGNVTVTLLDDGYNIQGTAVQIANANTGTSGNITNLDLGEGITVDLTVSGLADMSTPETVTLKFNVSQDKFVDITDSSGNALATPVHLALATTPGAYSTVIASGLVLNYNQSTISNGNLAFTVHSPATNALVLKQDSNGDGTYETEIASKAFTSFGDQVDFIDYGMKIQTGSGNSSGDFATFVLEKEDKSATMQIGANQGQTVSLEINNMKSSAIGISKVDEDGTQGGKQEITLTNGEKLYVWYTSGTQANNGVTDTLSEYTLDVSTHEHAAAAISAFEDAIQRVSAERSRLGAIQNRLEHTVDNLKYMAENTTAAESRIRDLDMAIEMTAYTKNNILVQSAQAMLAQANQLPQGVLQLLK